MYLGVPKQDTPHCPVGVFGGFLKFFGFEGPLSRVPQAALRALDHLERFAAVRGLETAAKAEKGPK